MRAHTLARVALLAIAGSVVACGAQAPATPNGTMQVAGFTPPGSGLADYHRATKPSTTVLSKPGAPDKPGHDGWNPWGPIGDWGFDGAWCPPTPWGPPGPWGLPFASGPYWPPVMVWGPFSPMPLFDVPGIPVGPVAPFYDPFGFGWAF